MTTLRIGISQGLGKQYPSLPVVSRANLGPFQMSVVLDTDYQGWMMSHHASIRPVVVSAETAIALLESLLNDRNAANREGGGHPPP